MSHELHEILLTLWLAPVDLADARVRSRLQAIFEQAGPLAPDTVIVGLSDSGGWQTAPWSAAALEQGCQGARLAVGREQPPRVRFDLGGRYDGGGGSLLTGELAAGAIAAAGGPEALVQLIRGLADLTPVLHGIVDWRRDLAVMDDPELRRQGPPGRLHDACWITVLGAAESARVGVDRLRAAPVELGLELPGGAFLLRATATPPGGPGSPTPADRQAQAALTAYLDPSLEAGEVLARLVTRDRWAEVARPPAAIFRDHDPDDLPPPPPEVLEAGAVLEHGADQGPPDFGLLAEGAVAFTHTRVGTASLPCDRQAVAELDRFLLENPTRWIDADEYDLLHTLAPAFGALTGEAMVRELGGQWLPGRRPLEHAVRVGEHLFLPVLRAALATRIEPGDDFTCPVRRHSLAHLHDLAARAAAGERLPHPGPAATRASLARFERGRIDGLELATSRVTVMQFEGGGRLWTGDGDAVTCWEVPSGRPLVRLGWSWIVSDVVSSGPTVLTLDVTGTLRVWDPATGERLAKAGAGRSRPTSLTVAGELAAWGQSKNVCVARHVEPRPLVTLLSGHSSDVASVALTDDEVVSIAREKKIRRWSRADLAAREPVPTGKKRAVSLAAAGPAVALLLEDGLLVLHPAGVSGPRLELGRHPASRLMFDGAGRLVLVSGENVVVLDPRSGAELERRSAGRPLVAGELAVLSPDLAWLATVRHGTFTGWTPVHVQG